MVLKLYGLYLSPWVRLVAAVLHEKQVPFELVSVDFFTNKEHKTPEYLEKHPFGQIPYIVCHSLFASEIAINKSMSCSGT
jgi:glutathione S-transferase